MRQALIKLSRKVTKGLTLVELLIVSLILAVTIVALVIVFINALNQINLAREMSIAAEDLSDVLEKMKTVSFANLTSQFPNGVAISASVIGGFLLNNEAIIVTYPQGISVDPLEIKVEATWLSKDSRIRSMAFKTLRVSVL
ncbi:MAG: type II secretion system protein [Candidatus Omnitrophota bacterium]